MPRQSGTFTASFEQLADCTQRRIESDSWAFGQPVVQSSRQTNLIRVSAIYGRSALFEVTFEPAPASATLVEYRRSFDGHGTEQQTWAIVQSCAHPS